MVDAKIIPPTLVTRAAATALTRLRLRLGLSRPDVLSRALVIYDLVEKRRADGWQLAFYQPDDGIVETITIRYGRQS